MQTLIWNLCAAFISAFNSSDVYLVVIEKKPSWIYNTWVLNCLAIMQLQITHWNAKPSGTQCAKNSNKVSCALTFNNDTFSSEFQPYGNWNSAVFVLFEWISFTLTFLNSFEEKRDGNTSTQRSKAAAAFLKYAEGNRKCLFCST